MSIFSRRNTRSRNRIDRKTAAAYRRLATESLEDRALLAADLGFQNQLLHGDVNADGQVQIDDAFALISELRTSGPRSLLSSGGSGGGGAEGEAAAGEGETFAETMFIDVNGDDYLSFDDVLSVIGSLRGEGAPGDVSVRLETMVGGVVSSTVGTGGMFTLNVYVQDNRTDPGLTPADLGVFSVDLDVLFNSSLVAANSTGVTPGPAYDDSFNFPSAADEAVGLVDNTLLLQDFGVVPEQQTLMITGGAAGDTFTLTINLSSGNSYTTGPINFDANAAAVQSAVDTALAGLVLGYTAGDLAVSGAVETGLTLEFGGVLIGEDHPPLTVDTGGYVTGTPSVTIMSPQDGSNEADPLGGGEVLLFSKTFTAGGTTGFADFQSGVTFGDPNGQALWTYATATPGGSQTIPFGDISHDMATIEIVELSPNEPVGVADSYTTLEDTPLSPPDAGARDGFGNDIGSNFGVLGNDTDPDAGDMNFTTLLRALLVGNGTTTAGGQVVLNMDGTFTYTPPADFNGIDTFDYIVSDPGLQALSSTTVTITVDPVPDDPTAGDDLFPNVAVNDTLTDTLFSNDEDGDSVDTNAQGIRIVSVTTTAGATPVTTDGQMITLDNGTLTINDRDTGDFTYEPNLNFIGVESFSYTIESFFTGTGVATGEPDATANVDIEVGLDPNTIGGFVFQDVNDNGVRESGELGVGGVVIELTGADFAGGVVNQTTTTDGNGAYLFEGVLPGNYAVREIHPTILRDGKEQAGNLGDTIPGDNDLFTFTLPGGVDAVDYNFGELGRQAEFISPSELLASSSGVPSLVGFSPSGLLQWYQLDPFAWPGVTSLSITLNGNGTATLTALDDAQPTPIMYQTTVNVFGDARFQVLAQNSGGLIVRLNGSFSDFFV